MDATGVWPVWSTLYDSTQVILCKLWNIIWEYKDLLLIVVEFRGTAEEIFQIISTSKLSELCF